MFKMRGAIFALLILSGGSVLHYGLDLQTTQAPLTHNKRLAPNVQWAFSGTKFYDAP